MWASVHVHVPRGGCAWLVAIGGGHPCGASPPPPHAGKVCCLSALSVFACTRQVGGLSSRPQHPRHRSVPPCSGLCQRRAGRGGGGGLGNQNPHKFGVVWLPFQLA